METVFMDFYWESNILKVSCFFSHHVFLSLMKQGRRLFLNMSVLMKEVFFCQSPSETQN